MNKNFGDWKYIGNTTKPGDPLWDEYENIKTGERTLKEYTPKKISNFDKCKHYWELADNNGNITCKYCGLGKRVAWGNEIVRNGKVIKPKKL